MRADDTTRNRPRRWSPTRALLWEHFRTRGMLAAMACALSWLLFLALSLIPAGFGLYMLSVWYFMGMIWLVLGLLLINGQPNEARSRSWPFQSHIIRLPVASARMVFIHYTSALAWVMLFVAPFGITAVIDESLSISSRYLAFTLLMFVLLHILVWASRIRYLFVLLVPTVAISVVVAAYNLFLYPADVWWAIAACVAVGGYFALWGVFVLFRGDHGFGLNLSLSLPAVEPPVGRRPFGSFLRAQVWLELRYYRPLLLGSLAVFGLMELVLWLSGNPVKPTSPHFLKSLEIHRFAGLDWLLLVAIFAGSRTSTPERSQRVFFFLRPVGTFRLAKFRLLALGRVACVLMLIAAAVEGVYRVRVYSAPEQTATEATSESSSTVTAENTNNDRDDSRPTGTMLKAEALWSGHTWPWMIIVYALILWCCLSSPGLSMFLLLGAWWIRLSTAARPSYGLHGMWFLLFALIVFSLQVISARQCMRVGLIVPRTILKAAAAVALAASLLFIGTGGFDSPMEIGIPIVTFALLSALPFTYVPWQLYRQRHR
ncbi:MAG: hypothetical protein R6V12_02440 [Candidatus Hydrogenedentota bacterium]